MSMEPPSHGMSIGQFRNRPGLRVTVNLEGREVGGVSFPEETWVPGVVIQAGTSETYVTIKLETAIGGGERKGLFGRESHGKDKVLVDDPARLRVSEVTDLVPEDIAELVRRGKKLEAIKLYRAKTGATLDEARGYVARF
ncbi:MAG TPA: hypothetical protein VMU95_14745 [Trebonia sp.]|nr:hypothetical protein [Trebonia sp.]